jgi:hypothetical protein
MGNKNWELSVFLKDQIHNNKFNTDALDANAKGKQRQCCVISRQRSGLKVEIIRLQSQ